MKRTGLKKIWGFFILLLFGIFLMDTCYAKAEAVSFSSTYYYLYLGKEGKGTKELVVNHVPAAATITFKSANETIATVDKNGVVTAVAPGDVRITCTVTVGDKTTTCKTTVKVRDNIKTITLGLKDTKLQVNALKRNTEYELTYTCKTDAGNTVNSGNYLYYEVYNSGGKIANHATVENGIFQAKRCAKFTVKVYCFLNESAFKKWDSDREAYASRLITSDELVLTVTSDNFATVEAKVSDWTMQIPETYFVSEQDYSEDVMVCSINAMRGKALATSNIHIRVDGLEEEPVFAELKKSMAKIYTKAMLAESWKAVYPVKSATVKNLKKQTVTLGGKKVYQISYDIILKNIKFVFEDAVDITISRLEYHNTIYTWYDGCNHITVNVIDAYEALQPNITEASKKLVESFKMGTKSEE